MTQDRGRSLSPVDRRDEAVNAAMQDGVFSGACAMIPSAASVYYFMKSSPKFVKSTNWQSRTALVIMPPLFVFGLASELKVSHKMNEIANEIQHSEQVSAWAHEQTSKNSTPSARMNENQLQLNEIYRKSIVSDCRIVKGDSLGIHHKLANFWQENPFKILTAISVPTVLYIFKGRAARNIQLQSMFMHTRLYGQVTVIALLLSLMGFKGYMDANGKYITEAEAERRVEDMQTARANLILKLKKTDEEEKSTDMLLKTINADKK